MNSCSQKSKDFRSQEAQRVSDAAEARRAGTAGIGAEDPDFAIPVELASASWLKELCREYFRRGFARGYMRGMHDYVASSHVNDSKIVRPSEVSLLEVPGGKRNG